MKQTFYTFVFSQSLTVKYAHLMLYFDAELIPATNWEELWSTSVHKAAKWQGSVICCTVLFRHGVKRALPISKRQRCVNSSSRQWKTRNKLQHSYLSIWRTRSRMHRTLRQVHKNRKMEALSYSDCRPDCFAPFTTSCSWNGKELFTIPNCYCFTF